MKATIRRPVEIEITTIELVLPVRYEEEDIPNDFPFRIGKEWRAWVDIDTGKIANWPSDYGAASLNMKVCDEGKYILHGPVEDQLDLAELGRIEDYVPHGVVPGRYGDYVELDIAADGTITNWPKKPDVVAFLPRLR